MIKVNFFLKGLIFFLLGVTILFIAGLVINQRVLFAILKLITVGIFSASLVFFIFSILKEKTVFKIFSLTFFIFTLTILIVQIVVEIKYALEQAFPTMKQKSQDKEMVDVTEKYSACVQDNTSKLRELQERSSKLSIEDYEGWVQLQREYLGIDLDLKKCLDDIFFGKRIFVK